jgi:hypothetical protein
VAHERQYCTFFLAGQYFGIDVVRERPSIRYKLHR